MKSSNIKFNENMSSGSDVISFMQTGRWMDFVN
jgi:hypothetical protein